VSALLLLLLAPLLFVLFCASWVRKGEAPQIYQPDLPYSRPGLWFCAHRASRKYSFQHLFIRITPHNPDWVTKHPDLFSGRDDAGLPFCTLGAGPKEGKLFLQFNRRQDLRDPVSFEAAVACDEDAAIASLIQSQQRYQQQLAFNAWPPVTGFGYNCNCMISALARGAGLRLPKFASRFMRCPGIERPVPEENFER
jgi:hypothetical protein